MARLTNECRRVTHWTRKAVHSVTDIRRRLQEENISISHQALTYARGEVVAATLFTESRYQVGTDKSICNF